MKTKPISEGQLPETIYELPRWPKYLWVLLATAPFFIGLFLNWPIKATLENTLKKQMTALSCPIRYNSLDLEFFLPKVILENTTILGTCFNSPGKDLQLSSLVLNFRGPSFFPPGPRFLITMDSPLGRLNIYHTLTFRSHTIKVEDTDLSLPGITTFFNLPRLQGHLEITSLVDYHNKDGLTSLDLLAKSKDLVIPPQNIQGLQLPTIPIKNFVLKASSKEKNKMQISEMVLGDQDSPIIAHFSGDLFLNPEIPSTSSIELTGEMRFSPNFLKDFAIINLFLNKYRQKNGFFQMKITGALDHPIFVPL